MKSVAVVKTDHGASYLKRLCNHFSHKVPTVATENEGTIEFPFGKCGIAVDEYQMVFSLDVIDPDDIERAESVVESHLVRMANRDEPVVSWVRA